MITFSVVSSFRKEKHIVYQIEKYYLISAKLLYVYECCYMCTYCQYYHYYHHYYYYFYHYHHNYFYYHLKYFPLKAGQSKQAHKPGGTLTQAVKQPYGICCLTGQHEQHEDNSQNHQQSSQPRLTKVLRRLLTWCQAQPYFQETSSSKFAHWYSDTANRLCPVKPGDRGNIDVSAIQHAKI